MINKPLICCLEMKVVLSKRNVQGFIILSTGNIAYKINHNTVAKVLNFCPFCGVKFND